MLISDCHHGVPVIEMWGGKPRLRVGHIVGFSANAHGEIIPVVKWHDMREALPCHHSHIAQLSEQLYRTAWDEKDK